MEWWERKLVRKEREKGEERRLSDDYSYTSDNVTCLSIREIPKYLLRSKQCGT